LIFIVILKTSIDFQGAKVLLFYDVILTKKVIIMSKNKPLSLHISQKNGNFASWLTQPKSFCFSFFTFHFSFFTFHFSLFH